MSERRVTTKAELMADIETGWSDLMAALKRLSAEQLITPRDDHGWAVKDHLVHLAAWERSVVYMLEGRPRHEGLDVSEELFLNGIDDDINAAIQKKTGGFSAEEALDQLRSVHRRLLTLLEPLDDEALRRPYRSTLPAEMAGDDERFVVDVIYGNSADHFREHLEWIAALINDPDRT